MSQYTRLLAKYQPILDNPLTPIQTVAKLKAQLSLANTTEES